MAVLSFLKDFIIQCVNHIFCGLLGCQNVNCILLLCSLLLIFTQTCAFGQNKPVSLPKPAERRSIVQNKQWKNALGSGCAGAAVEEN